MQEKYDRLIVITDEQAHDKVPAPRGRGYVINVGVAVVAGAQGEDARTAQGSCSPVRVWTRM